MRQDDHLPGNVLQAGSLGDCVMTVQINLFEADLELILQFFHIHATVLVDRDLHQVVPAQAQDVGALVPGVVAGGRHKPFT